MRACHCVFHLVFRIYCEIVCENFYIQFIFGPCNRSSVAKATNIKSILIRIAHSQCCGWYSDRKNQILFSIRGPRRVYPKWYFAHQLKYNIWCITLKRNDRILCKMYNPSKLGIWITVIVFLITRKIINRSGESNKQQTLSQCIFHTY